MNWMAPYVTIPVVILKPYGKPVVILKLYGKRCYMFGDQNTFNTGGMAMGISCGRLKGR